MKAMQRASHRSSLTLSSTRTSSTCLLNFDKITLSKFLTSLNIAQKVKKFKTLTSVKKNLGSLTKFFGKQRKFFLLQKKKFFLQRKNFLLQRKKILLQRKFSGERSHKKEGTAALLNFMQIYIIFQRSPNLHFATFLQKLTVLHPLLLFQNLQKGRFLQRRFWAQKLKCTKMIKPIFTMYYLI